jgi:protein-tyrosine phosphatase
MFSIFKKKYPSTPVDFSGIKTDMHSHLVPGIDDGSPDLDTSMALIKGLEELGYSKLITTPHIMGDMYKNTPDIINNGLGEVTKELKAKSSRMVIKAAAEYYLDDHFTEILNKEKPVLTVQQKSVLVEFSFVYAPMNLKESLFNLQIKGYQIILAHPERYQYFSMNKKMYDEFKQMGCQFQLNILSLTGYYGKAPQELANYLITKNYIDYVGTDLHHFKHLEALRNSYSIMPLIKNLLNSGHLLNPLLVV